MTSPLMQSSKPYRDSSSEQGEPWTPASTRTDPPLSSTSSRFEAHHLDPIEQSPPKPARESPNASVGLGISATSSPRSPWTDRDRAQPPSPEFPSPPHILRKQASTLSTHTVRGGNSFLPSHPPEPTIALSNSPAYSTSVPHLPEHPESDADVSQDSLKELPNRSSIASIASLYSNPEAPLSNSQSGGGEISRTGTFGAAQGAQIRASVSERFRKHLSGDGARQ